MTRQLFTSKNYTFSLQRNTNLKQKKEKAISIQIKKTANIFQSRRSWKCVTEKT